MSTERRVDPQTRRQGSAHALSMEIHPAAALFPLMSDDELTELAEDIKKNGLLEAITLHEGKVLDGRNRLAACELAGVEPRFEEWSGIGELPTRYVIAKNLQRRQLTLSQKAAIAAECMPLLQEEARKRQQVTQFKHGLPPGPDQKNGTVDAGEARQLAAKQVGVSPSSVTRAMQVKEADPVEFEKVRRGETTVGAAHTKAVVLKREGKQCSVIGCNRRAEVMEMCDPHYRRTRSGGPASPDIQRKKSREETLNQIQKLSKEGHSAAQISELIDLSEETIRDYARKDGIELYEFSSRHRTKLDISKMVAETVRGAENLIVGLDMVDGKVWRVEPTELSRLIASLETSVRVLARLLRQMKGMRD